MSDRLQPAAAVPGENDTDEQDVLMPTAVLGPSGRRSGPHASESVPEPWTRPGRGADDPLGDLAGRAETAPAPLLLSVGEIPGLRPRRRTRDGGEVPGPDVDLVDALPRPPDADACWGTVAAWLRAGKTAVTRRDRLGDLANFLRWLQHAAPGTGLWQVSEDHVVAYLDALGTGTGAAAQLNRGGRPLAPATVARRLSTLKSLYRYAVRRDPAVRHSPAEFVDRPEVPTIGTTPAVTVEVAAALLGGAAAIADEHPADAAAVALLVNLGLRAGELEGLMVGRIGRDAGHTVVRFRLKGGREIKVPLAGTVRALVDPLTAGRSPADLLLVRADGRSFDRWRQRTALRRAARAAGLSPTDLADLDDLGPHTLRATAATLLLDAGVPVDHVQALLGHASPTTTQRYNRGEGRLDEHAAYQLDALLTAAGTKARNARGPAAAAPMDNALADQGEDRREDYRTAEPSHTRARVRAARPRATTLRPESSS